jgi:DMSO/TMAO reductase YedYZ molybdopterin-dependent catalytic subunit
METRDQLPAHSVPPAAHALAASPTLHVAGLVASPRVLTPDDLAGLPRLDVADAFVCEEGWQVPDLAWSGFRLGDVLALARPQPAARYVRVRSGDYAVPLPLAQAAHALLCDHLDGAPLAVEHGAPWRLVVLGGVCYSSVKWVTHLDLTAEPGEPTGEHIARARLR